jgi:hypothetical protein
MLEKMRGLGLFGNGRISVLDVGSSNLYSAPAEGIEAFLRAYGAFRGPDDKAFADRLAAGSAYDPSSGGINGSFVGELFEKAGITYNAIDIADGYRTTIVDLNHDAAPPEFAGRFDLVLNFGTTEHLLNQYNAFKVMHDSTKVGGYIVNSLPCVGYSNHGYFTYTPRCMFDLAGYNEYEVVGFWFEGPGGSNDLFAPIRDYRSYFPALATTLTEQGETEVGRKIADLALPDIGLLIVYRKVKSRPFAGALERSTSVGTVPTSVTDGYDAGQAKRGKLTPASKAQAGGSLLSRVGSLLRARDSTTPTTGVGRLDRHDEIKLTGKAEELRERFVAKQMGLDESLQFYNLVAESQGTFPYDWECHVLLLALERDPERKDLSERLAFVRSQL